MLQPLPCGKVPIVSTTAIVAVCRTRGRKVADSSPAEAAGEFSSPGLLYVLALISVSGSPLCYRSVT